MNAAPINKKTYNLCQIYNICVHPKGPQGSQGVPWVVFVRVATLKVPQGSLGTPVSGFVAMENATLNNKRSTTIKTAKSQTT